MAGFFNKLKVSSAGDSKAGAKDGGGKKKDEPAQELTPLEKMLQNAGPIRDDGSDKFFGLENFGNTCYCNSIVQALWHTTAFRENILRYPPLEAGQEYPKVPVSIRPPQSTGDKTPAKTKGLSASEAQKQRKAINSGQPPAAGQTIKPEDRPDSPEYKKKQAMLKGPVLELSQEHPNAYGMDECSFTGLKDIFRTSVESTSRTGVMSPQRFLEVFKRDNEMFRNQMHQDAHEFYGLILNDIISNVEKSARRIAAQSAGKEAAGDGLAKNGAATPSTGWVHDIFEGLLTSETRCLACETTSQKDETFLDLSINLEEHTSVTSCLNNFSAEEMLCERNKFHCDHCGGLQEAEKRMKIKRLPKTLALHLKRFKYTEDFSRLQKLHHRVVYPYYLRLLHTTEDAEDPDRMYELYGVVVHIGVNAYHGHYVSIMKTPDRGWFLFDDEMVEPVDKHYVKKFFGDQPGQACAYVLFYQEITFEQYLAQIAAEGLEEQAANRELARIGAETNGTDPLSRVAWQPIGTATAADQVGGSDLEKAKTTIGLVNGPKPPPVEPMQSYPTTPATPSTPAALSRQETAKAADAAPVATKAPPVPASKTKGEKERDKKEAKATEKDAKAAEKARKIAEKERAKLEERQRRDNEARLREARRAEAEDLRKALALSRAMTEPARNSREKHAENGVRIPSPKRDTSSMSTSTTSSATTPTSANRAANGAALPPSMTRKTSGLGGFLKRSHVEPVIPEHSVASGADTNGAASASAIAQGNSNGNGNSIQKPEKLKDRFAFSIGRKKSNNVLS